MTLKNLIRSLNSLIENTSDLKTIQYAEIELSKAYYRDKNYIEGYNYSRQVLDNYTDLKISDRNSISLILARTAIKIGNDSIAKIKYKELLKNSINEEQAECMYYNAYFNYEEGNYDKVISIVSKMGEEVPEYKFWGGKALILMAKCFYHKEDDYQADFIIKSVIANIKYDEVQKEAEDFLQKITEAKKMEELEIKDKKNE